MSNAACGPRCGSFAIQYSSLECDRSLMPPRLMVMLGMPSDMGRFASVDEAFRLGSTPKEERAASALETNGAAAAFVPAGRFPRSLISTARSPPCFLPAFSLASVAPIADRRIASRAARRLASDDRRSISNALSVGMTLMPRPPSNNATDQIVIT